MSQSRTARPARGEIRAFVGIDCDVPHALGSTIDSYRGAYVRWGLPEQVHMHKLVYSGDPAKDFASAFAIAATISTTVYVSGTVEFFCKRSGGLFELVGTHVFRSSSLRRAPSSAA